jgi:hypothetical protein
MIFSENRYTLFRIMRLTWVAAAIRPVQTIFRPEWARLIAARAPGSADQVIDLCRDQCQQAGRIAKGGV